MKNIKSVQVYDPDSNEVVDKVSIIPSPDDITFNDGENLTSKVSNIKNSLETKSKNDHRHKKSDITDFPKKLSEFENDQKFVKEAELKNFHSHTNYDLLETLSNDLFNQLKDKYTKQQINDKLTDIIAQIKNICALKSHKHDMKDIEDYIQPLVPTRTSQLSNDSKFITKDYLDNWGTGNTFGGDHKHDNLSVLDKINLDIINNAHKHNNSIVLDKLKLDVIDNSHKHNNSDILDKINMEFINRSHKHNNSDILEKISNTLLESFSDKYTKQQIDDLIKNIRIEIKNGDNNEEIIKLLKSKAEIHHTHNLDELNGVDGHSHKNLTVIDKISSTYLTKLEDKYTKDEINKMLKNINTSNTIDADSDFYLSNIKDIYKITESFGYWEQSNLNISLPTDKFCTVSTNEYCYIIGGVGSNKIIIYNTIDKSIEKTIDLPGNISLYDAFATIKDNIIYIVGGSNGSTLYSTIITYDIILSQFVSINIPKGIKNGTCNIIDDTLYIIGGIDSGNNYLNTVDSISLKDGKYNQKVTTLKQSRAYSSSILFNNKIYVIGGKKSNSEYNNSIDLIPGNTSANIPISNSIYNNPYLCNILHDIYIIGGNNSKKCYKFDMDTNVLKSINDINIDFNYIPIGYYLTEEEICVITNNKKDSYKILFGSKGVTELNKDLNSTNNSLNEYKTSNDKIVNNKINLVITETLPDKQLENTLYFRVTDTEIITSVKVSPNMALRIQE